MDSFEYRNGRLHCEEVPVARIADHQGDRLGAVIEDDVAVGGERGNGGGVQAAQVHRCHVRFSSKWERYWERSQKCIAEGACQVLEI